MRRSLDSTGHRSNKGNTAKNALPYDAIVPPSASRLNRLHAEMIVELPATGEADDMSYNCANACWHECLQYSIEEAREMGRNFFCKLFKDSDHFKVRKMIRELGCADNGKVKKVTFTLIDKNKKECLGLWDCTVSEWHFRGKPKLIACCGTALDESLQDCGDIQKYQNQRAHSKRVKIARALPKEKFDVLRVMHEGGSEKEMAAKLNISVECLKKRKSALLKDLDLADRTELKDFIFQSSLF